MLSWREVVVGFTTSVNKEGLSTMVGIRIRPLRPIVVLKPRTTGAVKNPTLGVWFDPSYAASITTAEAERIARALHSPDMIVNPAEGRLTLSKTLPGIQTPASLAAAAAGFALALRSIIPTSRPEVQCCPQNAILRTVAVA